MTLPLLVRVASRARMIRAACFDAVDAHMREHQFVEEGDDFPQHVGLDTINRQRLTSHQRDNRHGGLRVMLPDAIIAALVAKVPGGAIPHTVGAAMRKEPADDATKHKRLGSMDFPAVLAISEASA